MINSNVCECWLIVSRIKQDEEEWNSKPISEALWFLGWHNFVTISKLDEHLYNIDSSESRV